MKKLLSLILIVVMCLSLTGCKSDDYKAAVELKSAGNYAEAAAAFEALGEYKDSAALLEECKTMISAIEAFDNAAAALEAKNSEIEKELEAASALVYSDGTIIDESLRPVLETAIAYLKSELVDVPDRPNSAEEMYAKAEEMSKADYTAALADLEESEAAFQASKDTYELVNNPSEAYVISCLKKVPGITGIAAATEDNDPNGKLGKAGGYTAAIFFSHEDVKLDTYVYGNTILEQGTAAGGQVEVYANEDDANKRNDYLSSFDGSVLSNGSHAVIGTCVVRTSDELKASQQKALESAIIEALTSME